MKKEKDEAEKRKIKKDQVQAQKEMDEMAERRKRDAQIFREELAADLKALETKRIQREIQKYKSSFDKAEYKRVEIGSVYNEWKSLRESMAIEFEKNKHSDRWHDYHNQEPTLVQDAKEQLKRFGVKDAEQIESLEDLDRVYKEIELEAKNKKEEYEKLIKQNQTDKKD